MEGAEQALMNEISATLSDAQARRLRESAAQQGLTVEKLASDLLGEGIDARYRMPRKVGRVLPIKGLERPGSST